MRRGLATLIVVIVIVAVIALGFLGTYNSLVSLDENVNSMWSQIDNQLQRRADLIPNLVETVKGYAAHEESIFNEVTRAREKLITAQGVEDKARAESELSGALSRLLAIVENYPNLKADANFRQLADELAGTENRIAVARMDYNNAVQLYNSRIRRFPTVVIAGMFGFEKRDYFEAEEGAEQAPKVDFSTKENN
ncbi:MAG: LemA family protein [Thermoanaerobacterales bacterium]|jgi:LemA protein|nr:LemA family protein [Thermoanaerobacterales bacterium]